MRNALVSALLSIADDEQFCFLTGDLGFNMLEPLRDKVKDRFINAGIAEQNMISVAAGLCREGMRPWVYSIAPFCYARPFEQIRNDICLHDLPVRLIGGGAGFGYGTAGPSHHAIEDCAAMSSLQNMKVIAPCFTFDMAPIVDYLTTNTHPCYIRLGRDERTGSNLSEYPAFSPFRLLKKGMEGVIVVLGAMAGMVAKACENSSLQSYPSIWSCSQLPFIFADLPENLKKEMFNCKWIMVIEDHVAIGGLGDSLSRAILSGRIPIGEFIHLHVKGYMSGRYGSQEYYRTENGLDAESILLQIKKRTDR